VVVCFEIRNAKMKNEKKMLSGNEAIARGAYEAGAICGFAYPGTPSTEILENFVTYPQVTAEWAPNEKVALELGVGSALTGARTLVTMKHVGLNVAADPLFTSAYIGVKGGLVIVTADDPNMYSSQNEQDNRHYARATKIPMLEPSDSQEAKEFTKKAFEISEEFDVPVFLRETTRIAHSKSIVDIDDKKKLNREYIFERDPQKYVMIPGYARKRHEILENNFMKLKKWAEDSDLNKEEMISKDLGIITSGIVYQYVKEVFPDASVLKLGMTFPVPEQLIKQFSEKVKKLYVIEELDKILTQEILAMGISFEMIELPTRGEIDVDVLRKNFHLMQLTLEPVSDLAPRPPALCPGCPHRALFTVLKKHKYIVNGDIGCYTLGVLPPLSAMDTCLDMGAGVNMAQGMVTANPDMASKVVSVIGDSTFLHSGITGLLNAVYNKKATTILILDNRITAMTGFQENPSSGYTLDGTKSLEMDFKSLALALGVKKENVRETNGFDIKEVESVLKEESSKKAVSVIINKGACALLKRENTLHKKPLFVKKDECISCHLCLNVGCSSLIKDVDGKVIIDSKTCNGCEVCMQVCPPKAIKKQEAEG